MWRHWLAGRGVIIGGLIVLLIGGWAVMLFHHPGWIIATGSIFAAISGMIFGGADAADGSEEFAFALPPTRSQRYLSGVLIGGGAVLAYCLIGTLSIALNLPQLLWSLVVDSGFTIPFGPWPETYLYFLAVVIPLLVLACTHACAALSQTRGGVWMSWLPAAGVTGAMVWLGCMAEEEIWGEINGYVSILSMLALGAMGLLFGHSRYVRKEGVSRPGRPGGGGGNTWAVLIVLGIVVVFALTMSLYVARVSHDSSSYPLKNDPIPPMGGSSEEPARAPTTVQAGTPTTIPSEEEQTERELDRQAEANARAQAAEIEAEIRASRRAAHDYSTIAITVPGVVLLIILLLIFLTLCRKQNAHTARFRGRRRRHIVTRSVCATLAAAILASIGFCSWRQAWAVSAYESVGPDSVRVPTKKAAPLTAEIKPRHNVQLTEARLLVKVMVIEATSSTGLRAVRTDEFDIAWRAGKTSGAFKYFKLGDSMVNYRFNINSISVRRRANSAEPGVHGNGSWNMRVNYAHSGGHSSSSGSAYINDGVAIAQKFRTGSSYRSNKPLSVISRAAEYENLILCVFVDLADTDDKLTAMPVERFIEENRDKILFHADRQGGLGNTNRRWRVDPEAPPAANLIEHTRFSSLLLLAAAILLGQLFLRRGLATAAMLATVVLYVAALDRVALGVHMSYIQDAEAPLGKRLIACQAAADTFFFAKTAANQLREIADDEASPDTLRYRARRMSRLLNAVAYAEKTPESPLTLKSTTGGWSRPALIDDGLNVSHWRITSYYRRSSGEPVTVAIQALPAQFRHGGIDSYMLWRVISSQGDPTGKITVIGPSLRAVIVGDESDMRQAVWAAQRGKLPASDVWTRLILPAAQSVNEE
jgi:hypothetical protein